jgi:hypothetical protein
VNKIVKYRLSFTGANAMIQESCFIAEQFLKKGDWIKVRESIIDNDSQFRDKKATSIRQFNEISLRLKTLTKEQLTILVKNNIENKKLIIAIAIAKAYQVIFEFINEVLRNKYLLFDTILFDSDFERFFEAKSLIHPEVLEISDNTKKKLKTVLYRILEQTGLISDIKTKIIQRPYIPNEILEAITKDNSDLLRIFLFTDSEIINANAKKV